MRYQVLTTAMMTVISFAAACDRRAAPAERPGSTAAPSSAAPSSAVGTETPAARVSQIPFTDRVWRRTDQGSAHGAMQVFLGNGTLISDSCFETYRLSSWRQDGDQITWSEDGAEVSARLANVDTGELVLQVNLAGGEQEQRFAAATVPYVCPDVPR